MMEDMKLQPGRFMKSIITKIIKTMVRKKLGYELDIQINAINVVTEEGKVRLHLDADVETSTEEFVNIISTYMD